MMKILFCNRKYIYLFAVLFFGALMLCVPIGSNAAEQTFTEAVQTVDIPLYEEPESKAVYTTSVTETSLTASETSVNSETTVTTTGSTGENSNDSGSSDTTVMEPGDGTGNEVPDCSGTETTAVNTTSTTAAATTSCPTETVPVNSVTTEKNDVPPPEISDEQDELIIMQCSIVCEDGGTELIISGSTHCVGRAEEVGFRKIRIYRADIRGSDSSEWRLYKVISDISAKDSMSCFIDNLKVKITETGRYYVSCEHYACNGGKTVSVPDSSEIINVEALTFSEDVVAATKEIIDSSDKSSTSSSVSYKHAETVRTEETSPDTGVRGVGAAIVCLAAAALLSAALRPRRGD